MKALILRIVISTCSLIFFINCNSTTNNNENKDKHKSPLQTEIESQQIAKYNLEIQRVANRYEELFNELMKIKDEPEFKIYGFGVGGPYNSWMEDLDKLTKDSYLHSLSRKKLYISDLEILALEYVKTEGEENEYTRYIVNLINQALHPKPTEDIEEVNVADDDILYGKWLLENSISRELNHTCEIYFKGTDYYSILTFSDNSTKTNSLRKEGNKFYIVGNRSGEYYTINPSNKKMTLHDNLGVIDMFTAKSMN